jgi:plasmid stability protein
MSKKTPEERAVINAKVAKYRKEHPEICSAQDRVRNSKEAARQRLKRWRATHDTSVQDGARAIFNKAVKNGLIVPPKACSACGKSQVRANGNRGIEAHHHNGYKDPFDVVFLCARCHKDAHRAARSAKG